MTRKELALREEAATAAYSIGDIETAIDHVMKLIERNNIEKLYRFRPPKMHEIDALQNNKIYLCKPSQYEDYDDCKIEHDIFDLCKYYMSEVHPEKYIKLLRFTDKNTLQYIEKRINEDPRFQEIIENIRNECLIACITQNCSKFMWKNYAQKDEGICFEYDIESIVSNIKKQGLRFFPIRYVDNRSQTQDICFNSSDYKDTHDSYQRAAQKYILSCLTKNKFPYSQEYEWRLICEHMKLNDGQTGALFDFIPPSKIILGRNISKNPIFESAITECAKSKDIPIVKM